MPRMKSTGDIPPLAPRGAVAPPPIDALGMTPLIAAPPGFSSFVTYATGEGGRSQRRWFGSFQTIQRRTHGNRSAAARAKEANDADACGGTFGLPPPLAHDGVPQIATTGSIPAARSASSSWPSRAQS